MELTTMPHEEGREARAQAADSSLTSGRALRSALVYTLGYGLQRALAFLMLPIYTRTLGPAQYGTLGVLLSILGLTMMALPLGLDIAVIRRYFEFAHDPARQRTFIDSTWRFLVVYPLLVTVGLGLCAWPIVDANSHAIGGADVFILLLSAAMWVAGTTVPLAVLRSAQALRKYVVMTAVITVMTIGLTALFVVVFSWGIRGWLAASLVANTATLLAAVVVMPWHRGSPYDGKVVRESLRFSLPFLPQSVSSWALQMADRLVIAGLVSGQALGAYTLAANIATPFMMSFISLNQGLMPIYASSQRARDPAAHLKDAVVLHIGITVAITLAGCLVAPPLVEVISPASFHGAVGCVAWLILGYGFLGLYFVPMNGATLGAGRGRYAWVATTLSAALNIGLLFAFVGSYGIEAAAIISAVAYLALLVGNSIYAHSGANPVTYDLSRLVPLLAITFGIYAVARIFEPSDALVAIFANLGWAALAAGLFVGLRLVPLRGVRTSS